MIGKFNEKVQYRNYRLGWWASIEIDTESECMDGFCRIGWVVIWGEGVECCFLIGQSALFIVVLTKCKEHKRVTIDTDENLVGLTL